MQIVKKEGNRASCLSNKGTAFARRSYISRKDSFAEIKGRHRRANVPYIWLLIQPRPQGQPSTRFRLHHKGLTIMDHQKLTSDRYLRRSDAQNTLEFPPRQAGKPIIGKYYRLDLPKGVRVDQQRKKGKGCRKHLTASFL